MFLRNWKNENEITFALFRYPMVEIKLLILIDIEEKIVILDKKKLDLLILPCDFFTGNKNS